MAGGTGVLVTGSERQVVPIRWVHQDRSFWQRMQLSIGPVSFLSRALGGKTPLNFIAWRAAFGKAGVLPFPHGIRWLCLQIGSHYGATASGPRCSPIQPLSGTSSSL